MRTFFLLGALFVGMAHAAEPHPEFAYYAANRDLVWTGVQAVLTCNGVFTSNRPLERVLAEELAYLRPVNGRAAVAPYQVDPDRKAVIVGGENGRPIVRAAFREGVGCVVMAPTQDLDDIDDLPELTLPYPAQDPARLAWPAGDLIVDRTMPASVDVGALEKAADWAFDRPTEEQHTLSLMVVYQGNVILERYADGVDQSTRTRTWSTAKSIAATLIGMLVDQGMLSLDKPLGLEWLPALAGDETDPRNAITLRHVMQMSSGLYPVDSFDREYAIGSGLTYWAGASSAEGARRRGLVREPGSTWEYENYDTLLAVLAMKKALGDDKTYLEFPRKALLDRIGMRNTLLSTDRFGDFILSSQVYTNARDLARFGLLYLNGGVWQGERLISEEWIEFVRTPAPSTAERGNFYGGQFWLVPDDRDDVPKDAYATAGIRGQYVIIVPSHDLVIVRRGLDFGRQGFNRWDLAREVLKAIRVSARQEAS